MKHNTYLFDFDGTLVDSMPFWAKKMLHILDTQKVKYPENIIEIITPLGDMGTAAYFRDVLGVSCSMEEMYARMDEYALPKYREEIGLKLGVLEYLTMLKADGCSLNVLTASPHKMLDPCLKRNGIDHFFDNIWSCDDFNTTKADVNIYKRAVECIGTCAENTVFFDDNLLAVQTAAQAGLFTVGVYDKTGEAFAEELKKTADYYIESFVDFYRI